MVLGTPWTIWLEALSNNIRVFCVLCCHQVGLNHHPLCKNLPCHPWCGSEIIMHQHIGVKGFRKTPWSWWRFMDKYHLYLLLPRDICTKPHRNTIFLRFRSPRLTYILCFWKRCHVIQAHLIKIENILEIICCNLAWETPTPWASTSLRSPQRLWHAIPCLALNFPQGVHCSLKPRITCMHAPY